jgi:20S proteasome subunit beta 1
MEVLDASPSSINVNSLESEWFNAEHRMGTTIMAVQFVDGVILGADSRTTTGSYIANRVTDKITKVHDLIYCCRSGSAADTQAIADVVHYYAQVHAMEHGEPPEVKTVATLFQQLCYNNKDQLQAGIIVAGWDPYEKGSIYSIPLGGSLHRQLYTIGGSGSSYIYGFCDTHFKKDMTKDEGIGFVKTAISLAMARDGSSGGVIRLAIIEKTGLTRLVFKEGDFIAHIFEIHLRLFTYVFFSFLNYTIIYFLFIYQQPITFGV